MGVAYFSIHVSIQKKRIVISSYYANRIHKEWTRSVFKEEEGIILVLAKGDLESSGRWWVMNEGVQMTIVTMIRISMIKKKKLKWVHWGAKKWNMCVWEDVFYYCIYKARWLKIGAPSELREGDYSHILYVVSEEDRLSRWARVGTSADRRSSRRGSDVVLWGLQRSSRAEKELFLNKTMRQTAGCSKIVPLLQNFEKCAISALVDLWPLRHWFQTCGALWP